MLTNHHENIYKIYKQCIGGVLLFTVGLIYLFFSICGILGTLFFIAGDIDSNGNLYIKTACIDSDISCYGLFQFSPSFTFNNKNYSQIFYYIYIKKISKSDQAKNMASLITILLIYFCQFYVTLFDKILNFNFDKARFGKCLVHESTIKKIGDKPENFMIDNINVTIDNNEEYYKNYFNDSYFNTLNISKESNIKGGRNIKYCEGSETQNKVLTNERRKLPPINSNINSNIIRVSSNLKNNK